MKNFKIGLTAIVLVVATSFTVASKDEILGKVKVSDGCYTSVTIDQTPPNPPITYGSSQSPTNPCPGNPKPQACEAGVPSNNPVTSASGSVSNYKTTGCGAPYNLFCCYEVISNAVKTIYYRN